MERVRREATEADGNDPLDEAVTLHLKHHGLDGSRFFTHGQDGFALRRGTDLDLVVRPGARRRGIGADLAARATAEPGPLAVWSHGNHPGAARLAASYGLRRERDLWVMRLALDDVTLPALVVPAGVELRGYEDADAEDLLRVNAAAFAQHPEQGAMDAADLAQRMGEDWFDPDGLILGHDTTDGRLLGFHWTKRASPEVGEVYVVGIAPEAQGRGLGKALTLAGLHHLAGRGVAEIELYVESDNHPAVAVYAGLGFTHAERDTHVRYART